MSILNQPDKLLNIHKNGCEIPLILAGQSRPGHLDAFLRWVLNREPDIKNIMTRWADKKPPGDIIFRIEHRMKTIFVTTCRADLKLGIHFNVFNFVIHAILHLKEE